MYSGTGLQSKTAEPHLTFEPAAFQTGGVVILPQSLIRLTRACTGISHDLLEQFLKLRVRTQNWLQEWMSP